jgi:hypothetical protein
MVIDVEVIDRLQAEHDGASGCVVDGRAPDSRTHPSGYPAAVQILALERAVPGVRDDAFTDALLRTEAERLWELHQAGVVRQAFFRTDRDEAVLLLEAADAEAARSVLDELPLVSAGFIDFEVITLRAYPGFARLFG